MTPVKTIQRYKCDFCKYRSVKHNVEIHEKRCFRNPNRFCDNCENNGWILQTENDTDFKVDCPYCASFNKKMLQEIEARENKKINISTQNT